VLIYRFWRNVYSSLLSTFALVCFCCCCCCCRIVRAVYKLDINPSSDIDLQIFFPFHELPFHFIDCVLWCITVLHFDVVQFTAFSFFTFAFGVTTRKSLPKSILKFMWNLKRSQIAKIILIKKKVKSFMLPDFNTYHKAVVIKTGW